MRILAVMLVITILTGLTFCVHEPRGEPAPPGYWHKVMCQRASYQHLAECSGGDQR